MKLHRNLVQFLVIHFQGFFYNAGSSSVSSLHPSYQSILNDLSNDSLEEYMEIAKPENTHLEQLVKNMDGTVTDPNQCLMCKRILSCKSALMVRYKIHVLI